MRTDDLIGSLAAEGAKKPLPPVYVQVVGWMLGTFVWFFIFGCFHGVRPDLLDKVSNPFYLVELVCLAALGLYGAVVALFLARPDGAARRGIWYVLTFLCGAAGLVMAYNMYAAPALPLNEVLDVQQFDCTKCIIALSVPPAIAIFLLVRSGAPLQAGRAGFLGAAAVAVLAYLCMRILEANDNLLHLLLWHALPVFVLSMVGWALGRVFLRWRVGMPQ